MTRFQFQQGMSMPGFNGAFGSTHRPRVCPTRAIQIVELTPQDAQLQMDYFNGLSDASKYFRFMTALSGLSRSLAHVLCELHPERHVVLMAAVREQGRVRMIGEARYVRDQATSPQAEFAVSVADDWQGTGLAGKLLAALEAKASSNGVVSCGGKCCKA